MATFIQNGVTEAQDKKIKGKARERGARFPGDSFFIELREALLKELGEFRGGGEEK